ncbi:MAG: Bcr/CflA family multidrug efflux MFS transporter [Castellaniella sp.]
MTSPTDTSFPNRIPGWLLLMGLLTALGPLAIDMYLPAFPAIAQDLGTHHGHVEQTLAGYLFGLALAQLFYGPIADRFGRRRPLLLGLCIFIIATMGCAQAQDIGHLVGWRIAQAFGGAAGMVIPRAVIRDNFDTRDASRALSLLLLIMGVTPILAPILGGQLLIWTSWRWIFHAMTLIAGLLLLSAMIGMRETLAREYVTPLRPGIIARNYRELLAHRRFLCYTLAGGFGSAGMFTYIAGSPRIFMEIYGVDPRWFGVLFGLNAAALIVSSQISARLLSRHAPEQLLRRAQVSLVAMTIPALALTLADQLDLIMLMFSLMGFMASQGFVNPNSAALALHEQGHRLGAASAMMGALQMLCGAGAGVLVSLWQSADALPLTGLLAACALLSWLFGRLALKGD